MQEREINNNEILRTIKNYDGYLISTSGKVYSLKNKQFLKQEITKKKYLRVTLYKYGKAKHHKVHRLVAETYIPNIYNKPQVNHIDGNTQNNNISNLEWVSNLENCIKAKEMRRQRLHRSSSR